MSEPQFESLDQMAEATAGAMVQTAAKGTDMTYARPPRSARRSPPERSPEFLRAMKGERAACGDDPGGALDHGGDLRDDMGAGMASWHGSRVGGESGD